MPIPGKPPGVAPGGPPACKDCMSAAKGSSAGAPGAAEMPAGSGAPPPMSMRIICCCISGENIFWSFIASNGLGVPFKGVEPAVPSPTKFSSCDGWVTVRTGLFGRGMSGGSTRYDAHLLRNDARLKRSPRTRTIMHELRRVFTARRCGQFR